MSDFNLDLRELERAGREILNTNKKKTIPDVLNRAGLVAIIGGKGVKGAIQRTPRADKSKIAGLNKKAIRGFVANKLRKKGIKVGRGASVGGGRDARGKFTKSTATAGGISREDFDKLVKAEIGRRKRAIGYTAGPGWSKAAKAFGGRGVRGVQSGFAQSKAAKGSGKKASSSEHEATMENTAPAAEKIGRVPLQAALDDTAADMIEHARERLQRTFDRHKGRA